MLIKIKDGAMRFTTGRRHDHCSLINPILCLLTAYDSIDVTSPSPISTVEMFALEIAEGNIGHKRESKRQLKPHVAPKTGSNKFANWT